MIATAAIVECPADLLYLTGLQLSRGALMATREEAVLFVDGRYFAKAQRQAPCAVRLWEEHSLFQWLQGRNVRSLEFDSTYTSCERYEALKIGLPEVSLMPRPLLLKEQRGIKDAEEIAALKRAFALTLEGFEYAKGLLKEAITEEEIAFAFELYVRKRGATGLSFEPIVAFGENSAYPHYRAGKTALGKNQIVLIDVGAVLDSYRGDLTRVVFFGDPDPTLAEWLAWTKEAQQKAIELARPGCKIGDLDRAAREVFARHGVEELFVHGLGHGIGLETHEFPSVKATGVDRDTLLQPGMVITIEPGLYKPGLGGVRWEDMVLITEEGCESL